MGLSDSFAKRYLGLLLLVGLGAALPTGCAPVQEASEGSTQASVYRLPWLDSKGNYTLQDISLLTFRDPDRFQGDVGEIIIDPRLSEGSVVGGEALGRYIRDGSRRVPADFVTLQAATMYAHLEKLSEIDQATGVAKFLKTKSRIGLLSRVAEKPSSPVIVNNAIYDGRLDSLFVVPYVGSKLFVSLNAGILGHEHFHRIFQAIILNPLREAARMGTTRYGWDDSIACMGAIVAQSDQREPVQSRTLEGTSGAAADSIAMMKIQNQVLIRGFNEGLADFWGWAYSRDDEFFVRSIGTSESTARRLDIPATSIPLKSNLRSSLITRDKSGQPRLRPEEDWIAISYQIGTQYARILRGVVEALAAETGSDSRQSADQVRLALASALPEMSAEILLSWGREEVDPELLLKPMFAKLLTMSASGPAVLDAAGSNVVCDELQRLRASANLMRGLCGSSVEIFDSSVPR